MINYSNLSNSSFLKRQIMFLRVTLFVFTIINIIYTYISFRDKIGHPKLNIIYLIFCCLPTFYFLKKSYVKLATHFIYFPAICILSGMVYNNLQSQVIRGNLENAFIPIIALCGLFDNTISRNIGIISNLSLLFIFKVIRYNFIPMELSEVFDDLTVVISMVVVALIAVFYYKRDYETLADFNNQLQSQKDIIEQQAAELKISNNVKNQLFSIIAHDLRGPIISLKGLLQLFESNNISKEKFKTLSQRLSENVNSMHLLLDNLLIYSFSQIKNTKPNYQNILFSNLINETLLLYKEALIQKNIKLSTNFTNDLSIWGDEQQIKITIRNLLNNAIKFTQNNGQIVISALQQVDDTLVTIEDNGIGIQQEDLTHIFLKPKLNNGTNGEKGTGLGISLCKEMIENHKGSFEINSQIGVGTTVSIKLPNHTKSTSSPSKAV